MSKCSGWPVSIERSNLGRPHSDLSLLYTVVDWCDHGRDILNFVASYLDSPAANVGSTTFLPRLDTDARVLACKDAQISDTSNVKPSSRIWRDRIVVGIGHSLGAAGMGFAASAAPSLFSSVIFCDPVMVPPELRRSVSLLSTGALVRRDEWKTQQEAREGFLKKDFFRQWDPRVLERYCGQGLKQVKNGVALKTRAIDEAVSRASYSYLPRSNHGVLTGW